MADIDDIFDEYEGSVDQELVAIQGQIDFHLSQAANLEVKKTQLTQKLAKAARARVDVASDVLAVPAAEDLDGP